MTVIGSASVDIRANDKFFERDVRKIVKGLKDVTLNIKADVDLTKVNKKLRDFRSRNTARVITLHADLNTTKLDKKMEKMWNSYDGQSIDVGFSQTGLDKIESQLKEIKDLSRKKVRLNVEIDEDAIQDSLNSAEATINATAETADAQAQLDEVARTRQAEINADADTAIAEAQLAMVSRNRTSTIRASLDPETVAGLKGFFYTLTGAIPADKVKSILMGMSANFEAISVKAGVASTGVMGLASSLLHLTGDALTISGDITQVVGLLAAIPAAAGMGAVAISSLMLGWKGFAKAMGTGKEAEAALKTLPLQAQEAIKGIKGVGGTMRQIAQQSYWKELGTSLQDTVKIIQGPLTKGLQGSSKAMGQQTKALFESFQRFTSSGALADTFNNINESISRGARAMSGFTDGFLNLMQGGSKSLPRFGTWMGDLGDKFSKWAKEANESGEITVWIDTATQRLKELGSIIKSTTGIFSGLTNAARNAGMNGLPELAGGLEKVSDIVNSPKFQAGMTDIFLSARKSVENMSPGIKSFFDMFAKGTPKIGRGMEIAGSTVGQLFQNISKMFESGDLGDGLIELLSGMKDAMKTLEPGFGSLGKALGGLARVAGEVIRSMAPGLNQLFDTLDGVINGMADGMIAAMPVFNQFMQSILATVKAVVVPIANVIGNLLEMFAGLPGPIQTAVMAVAASMLLLKSKVGTALGGLGTTVARTMTGVGNSLNTGFIGPLTRTQSKVQSAVNGMKTSVGSIGTIWRTAAATQKTSLQNLQNSITSSNAMTQIPYAFAKQTAVVAKSTTGAIGKTVGTVGKSLTKGLGSALGGVMGVLGGPWGLALAGGVAALSGFAQANADAKQQVEDLKNTLSKSGDMTSETQSLLISDVQKDKGDFFDKVNSVLSGKGFKGADVTAQIESMGKSTADLTSKLTDPKAREAWAALHGMSLTGGNGSQVLDKLGDSADDVLKAVGLTREEFSKLDSVGVGNVTQKFSTMSSDIEKAKKSTEELRQSVEQLNRATADTNKSILNDVSSSVGDKLNAFKSNQQIFGLEQLSGQSGAYDLGITSAQNETALKELRTSLAETKSSITDTFSSQTFDGSGGKQIAMFKMNTEAGRKMYDVMRTQADGIKSSMISSYDTVLKATGDVTKAQEAAFKTSADDIGKFTKQLTDAGLDTNQIETLLDTAGLSSKDIEIALKTEGTDQAIADAQRVQAAMDAFNNNDYTAIMSVTSEDAQAKMMNMLGLTGEFDNKEFVAKLRANFENEGQYQQWRSEFTAATPEQRLKMVADLTGGAEVLAKINEIKGKGSALDGKKFSAIIETVATNAGQTVEQVTAKINSLPKETIVSILAENKGDPAAAAKAIASAAAATKAEVKVEANSEGVKQEIDAAAGTTNANVNVQVNGTGQLDQAKSAIDTITDKSVSVKVNADSGNLEAIKSAMDSIKNKSVKISVNANSKSISEVKSAMDSIKNKSVKVSVSANSGSLKTIKASMDSIKNKSVKITVTASSGAVKGLQGAINGIKAKTVQVKANVSAAMSAISKVQGAKISPKTLTINGNAGPALSAIARVNAARVVNKTQTITTIRRTVGGDSNANGGMYMNNVRMFANGGKMDPRALRAMRSFKGGSENHRAQISKSATQFRIWGEPETGGEAYIPLAASKRSRSLKILEQVAQHFGVSLSHQFANGGFMSGMSLGAGVTSYASGGTTKATDKKAETKRKEAEKKAKDLNNELKKAISDLKNSISDMGRSIKEVFGQTQKSPVQSALSDMNKDLKAFAKTYSKSKPKEAARARAASKLVEKQYSSSKVWQKKYTKNVKDSKGKTRKQTYTLSTDEMSRKIAQDAVRRQKKGNKARDYNGNYTLRDYERALESVDKQLEKAQTRLDNVKNAQKSVATGIAGSMFGSVNIGDIQNDTDLFGNKVNVTSSRIRDYLSKKKKDMSTVSSNLDTLRKKGFNKAFLSDIANMSLEDALAYTNALKVDGAKYMKDINRDYTSMFGANGQYNLDSEGNTYVGGIAKQIGDNLSKPLFESGRNAAQGLVNGLKSEKKALEVAGRLLSDALIKAIKKALKIKSPSRVMMGLGKFIPQGMAIGIDQEKSIVDKSMGNLVDTTQVDLSVPTRSDIEFSNSQRSGIMNRTGSQTPIQINQTINPSQGMSEEQIGKSASNNILFRLGTLA